MTTSDYTEADNLPSGFWVRSSGNVGQELLDPDGVMVAWSVDPWLAQVIARLLTEARSDGTCI